MTKEQFRDMVQSTAKADLNAPVSIYSLDEDWARQVGQFDPELERRMGAILTEIRGFIAYCKERCR